tara:strand:+ start:213 stop:824 length:612 start_codon:yes stop_codon:yes gene_type:complete
MIRVIIIALLALTLANCAEKTYKVKQEAKVEDGRVLNKVPQWFVDAKIDKGLIKDRDADSFIYGVGSGTSPDLQLAIDKAIMVAKASLADQLQGEMNKRADLYITEVGQEGSKQVATKVEQTIVNVIKNTKVQGYEEWQKAVLETPVGTYRVYIGLKYGVGDANKLAEYIVEYASAEVDVNALADKAINNVIAAPVEKVTEVE